MSGMRGDADEQPARSSAVETSGTRLSRFSKIHNVHSNIIATAMRIMRTWWYPNTGTNPAIVVSIDLVTTRGKLNGMRTPEPRHKSYVRHLSLLSSTALPNHETLSSLLGSREGVLSRSGPQHRERSGIGGNGVRNV